MLLTSKRGGVQLDSTVHTCSHHATKAEVMFVCLRAVRLSLLSWRLLFYDVAKHFENLKIHQTLWA